MPFVGYDDLVLTIARFLGRDDLENDIQNFIHLAEVDIQRNIHFRFLDRTMTGTTVPGQTYIELPLDYAEGGFLNWLNTTLLPSFEIVSHDITARNQRYPASSTRSGGDASVGTIRNDRIHIGAAPGAIDYEFYYKAEIDHLGPKNPTNRILDQYPDCLLYGALVIAAPFLGADERVATWLQFYDNAKEETRQAEWRSRSSGGALRMRTDVRIIR